MELDWEAKKSGFQSGLTEEEKQKNQSSEGVENKESAESAKRASKAESNRLVNMTI